MDEHPFSRRASYGSSSPVVGTRGARTRQQIVDAALHCFTDKGFHGTAVEDIATQAETSRATLYQYFESKEAIFKELMNESGNALMRVTRRLGQLGPTAEGFDSLHWWLGEWSWVFDRYAALFIEWANVNSPKAPLRSKIGEFIENYTIRFRDSLLKAGFDGDPSVISLLVLGVTSRYNYIRHVYRPGPSDSQMLDSLAIALQLLLFPTTPKSVLDAGPLSVDHGDRPPESSLPVNLFGPLSELPARSQLGVVPPTDGLSAQASKTVRQLLDAAGTVFADTGYGAANVDQIVSTAKVARGTFYRYFRDKLDLMIALANECARDMHQPWLDLATLSTTHDEAELRDWLHRFIVLHDRYTGVMRAWTEGLPIDPKVLVPCREVVADMSAAVRDLYGPTRSYALDRRAVGVMLAALLEHFPNEGKGTRFEPSAQQIVEAQALFIERVILVR